MNAAGSTVAALVVVLSAVGCGHEGSAGSNVGQAGTQAGFAGGFSPPPSGAAGTATGAAGASGTSAGTAGGSGSSSSVTAGNAATAGTSASSTGSGGAAGMTTGMTPGGSAGTGAGAAGGGAPTSGGGYIVSGNFKGYAWTGVTGMASTIMPKDFAGLAAGAPLCVMGMVEASADYSAVGMLGVNLNQANTMNAPLMTVTPTGMGLMVDINNTGNSLLRVQVQTPDGDMNADHRWCAPISGKGGLIPWATFNTKCWDNSGTAYAMEPISTAIISVPSMMTTPVNFNFCLNSLGEAGGTTAMPTAGSGAAGSGSGAAGMSASVGGPGTGMGTLTGQYDWHNVTKDGRDYIVQNNVWGGGAQTIDYLGTTFQVTKHDGNNPTNGQPGSYPSVFIGSNNGHTTMGSNLPKQVSALTSVQTTWAHNAGSSIGGTYNAAYDVWFSTNAGGDSGAPSGGYLMVWLYKTANVQPLGNSIAQSGATIQGVEGTWDVWIGQQMGKPCVSYVRTQQSNSMTFDLNKFIQDATKRAEKPIQSTWYLTNVFAGFEIWSGGVGLKTTEFSAVVQ
jgi:Glycosyl hydrolase family 12